MATIYKCDKCSKIIKDKRKEVYFGANLASYDLMKEYGLPGELTLCKTCGAPLLKYLNRFLNKNTVKKATKNNYE
ncbi:hypothetical protein COT99_03865 [Candidatus Falkowbacteria bacterium CG10_big_fil_rev_8_21_14_0_10_43_10]|uniref:Uncharacterized protein n=1 Tax=Candidatus Falkowbacteria bacterium CG10_big_fil_rev_8_21_14_0_10_43_10 TaxID=1974567 RepID=A0A2H0V1A1_9BACT|nr:MAG: hypothetical protein COT99_03865 [Candidatus Falkowbacteria bacterium CG10_big_fil_rev_8_21_14_0_10_43_10]